MIILQALRVFQKRRGALVDSSLRSE